MRLKALDKIGRRIGAIRCTDKDKEGCDDKQKAKKGVKQDQQQYTFDDALKLAIERLQRGRKIS